MPLTDQRVPAAGAPARFQNGANVSTSTAIGQTGGLRRRSTLAAVRDATGAVVGAVLGLVPHVMHHVGLITGAALVSGASGNAAFLAIGLAFSIPLLRRLYRKFRSWRAPAIAIAVFTAMFALSAFVIGPAISGSLSPEKAPVAPTKTSTADHTEHHSE